MPLDRQFEQIAASAAIDSTSIGLPSPLSVLLDLAQHHYRTPKPGRSVAAEKYVSQVFSLVLEVAFTEEPLAYALKSMLRSSKTTGLQLENLELLLMQQGSHLGQALESPTPFTFKPGELSRTFEILAQQYKSAKAKVACMVAPSIPDIEISLGDLKVGF